MRINRASLWLVLWLMAISFVNAGAEGSAGSGDITLGAPASPAIDDLWIAVVHSSDQVAHTFTDWTQIVQGNGGGTTSRISVWYFRYAGSTPNLVVGHSAGQSPIGGIGAYRGVKKTGSPVDTAGAISGGTDASIEHAAINPTQADCALLVANGAADDNTRTALGGDYVVVFEDSAGGTQNCFQTAAGTPDGSVSLFHDILIPDADTGTITVTQSAADPWASVLIALAPDLTQILTATAPVATISAPTATRQATVALTAGAPVATITAPTASLSAGAPQTLVAGAPVVTISAPTMTRVATVSLPSGAPIVTLSAPTATRLANITRVLLTPTVSLTASAVTLATTVSVALGAATISLQAPVAVLTTGGGGGGGPATSSRYRYRLRG